MSSREINLIIADVVEWYDNERAVDGKCPMCGWPAIHKEGCWGRDIHALRWATGLAVDQPPVHRTWVGTDNEG